MGTKSLPYKVGVYSALSGKHEAYSHFCDCKPLIPEGLTRWGVFLKRCIVDKIERVLRRLQELSEGAMPQIKEVGLCYELYELCNYDIPAEYLTTWEHYSGDNAYPVFDTNNKRYKTAERQYDNIVNLWKGSQGKLRRDLCKHLVKEVNLAKAQD